MRQEFVEVIVLRTKTMMAFVMMRMSVLVRLMHAACAMEREKFLNVDVPRSPLEIVIVQEDNSMHWVFVVGLALKI